MNFSEKIEEGLLRVDFTARDKDDALRQMGALAATAPLLSKWSDKTLCQKLAEREAAVSTGLGGGIAIPHARLEGLDDFVVFVLIAPKGVDFEALDDRKVQIFFVVFAPADRTNEHLKLLASISSAISQARLKKEMLSTTTPEVLAEVISRATVGDEADSAGDQGPRKLLLIILFYEQDVQGVLEYLIDQGVEGATILDAKGMGAYVSAMPLFASFLNFMREDRNTSQVIMTLIGAHQEKQIVQGIERITGDLDRKQGAMLISLDVSFYKGTLSMI